MKIKKLTPEIELVNNVSFQAQNIIINAVYNTYHIKVFKRLNDSKDTTYYYNMYLTSGTKISKQQLNDIKHFINGILYTLKAI